MSCDCNQLPSQNCGNPCGITATNTAACENLESQISNFSTQFFGLVVKTEINGVVTWSLPCHLDVGLPMNPRAAGEGLSCYFLRLFSEGIIGLKGDTGATGAAGTNGHNAYTVSVQHFTQPTLGSPNVTVLTSYNPAILAGMYVFITSSGHYLVNAADVSGSLSLTLTKAVVGATGTITAGKLVVPSGYPGPSVTGPQGPAGPQGATGSAAASLTITNVEYYALVGNDFVLGVGYQAVNFTNSSPQLLLTQAGTYLVTAVVGVVGTAGVATSDVASFKLRNTSINGDIAGSEQSINFLANTQMEQVIIIRHVTTDGANQTIALFGKATTDISAVALRTTMTAVRIA